MSPEEFGRFIASENGEWAEGREGTGIKPE